MEWHDQLLFIVGFMVGGTLGVIIMACLIAVKITDEIIQEPWQK